jgi:predicted ferric reductase
MKKRFGWLALTWFGIVILPVPLIILLNRQLVDTSDHLFAYDCGIVAYVWWLVAIYLSTRPRWLVNRVGMPFIYMVHGMLGIIAIAAATAHKFLSFSMFPLIKDTGNIAWYLEIFLMIYAVLFLSGWLVDRVKWIHQAKQFLENHGLKHQISLWIHRLNWFAVALIWLHVQLINRLAVPGFRFIFNLYTFVVVILYLWWKYRQTVGYEQGIVISNEAVDDQLQALTIKLANNSHSFAAGDFYFIRFQNAFRGSSEYHPFSVFSKPNQNREVTFMIQRLGDFTKQVAQVPTGTKVKLEGPFGLFDQEVKSAQGPVVLYGLGSGVAPLISLADQYYNSKSIHLVWSGPQIHDDYYQKQLNMLRENGVVVSAQEHRFAQQDLQKLFTPEEISNGIAIVVGSANKVIQVEKQLRRIGWKRSRIKDERLTM